MREVFAGVRLDVAARVVEFDAVVPIDCHDAEAPKVYLEVSACIADSKEHETLVVTTAKPSHVHAALLAAGFQSGTPGIYRWQSKRAVPIPPTGDAVRVEFIWMDSEGRERRADPATWVVNDRTGKTMLETVGDGGGRWVFAGSRLIPLPEGGEFYDADGAGTLIGLTTFGSETIAWSAVYSPESSIQAPEWIADARIVPRRGDKVTVRISAP